MKPGFHPHKDKEKQVEYAKYHLIPGIWVYSGERNPELCWGVFSPDKKYLGCKCKLLDAKEIVKNDKIRKYMK
jgi:hypothetical protein